MTEVPLDMPTLNQCVSQASQVHGIHPIVIKSLIAVEGGQVGTYMKNTNGSYDMGVMQVNTINLQDITSKFGFTARDLVMDPCKNIMAGTWLLWQRIQETPKKLWVAVGNYHSKTPDKRHDYLKKVEKAYSSLLPVYGKPEEAKALGRTTNWGQAQVIAQSGDPFQFPSISELEALVAQGGGVAIASAAPQTGLRKAAAPRKPERTIVRINNKRNVLRFID